mmetsp:Transcript_9673/g.17018  ORF Transcript_9673/g.17018 Transcript_9673/m.17018 type:complete len:285 (-) Transcript_9673:336-1190(-)|eukprot:CAMPEP_0178742528 /NCGR_PEP_ID=MMETSP0744-20121128/5728_1 /TAXON_ID=913974 /ORGANISM="Nitzschia punctata, Strain CCMP561" /LENGTH=284 /DNA_ID=CAMNT_0020395487 /DNA_START=149 /DNA_END=1003 /DNA_ORIENTATION=-
MKQTCTSSIDDTVEWSPHVFTQRIKEETNNTGISEEPSSPARRRVSTGSSTASSSDNESDDGWGNGTIAEAPTISFQALSLQQQTERGTFTNNPGKAPSSVPGSGSVMAGRNHKRRTVKARVPVAGPRQSRQQTEYSRTERFETAEHISNVQKYGQEEQQQQVALTPRTNADSSFMEVSDFSRNLPPRTTTPFASIDSKTCPAIPAPVSLCSTVSASSDEQARPRGKRERGGSDFTMTPVDVGCGGLSATPVDRRKRRRLNRNHALAADDFDLLLSQISASGSF